MLSKTFAGFIAVVCLFVLPILKPSLMSQKPSDQANQEQKSKLPFEIEGGYILVQFKLDIVVGQSKKFFDPELRTIDGIDYLVGKNETETETHYVKYDDVTLITVPSAIEQQDDVKDPELEKILDRRTFRCSSPPPTIRSVRFKSNRFHTSRRVSRPFSGDNRPTNRANSRSCLLSPRSFSKKFGLTAIFSAGNPDEMNFARANSVGVKYRSIFLVQVPLIL